MIKINVVDLKTLYNFVVKTFLIWIHLGLQNSICNFLCRVFYFWHSSKKVLPSVKQKHSANNFQYWRNSNIVFAWLDGFKTKSYQLQSFITFWDLQSLFREFFCLKNQILKWSIKNAVLHDKMNSNKKVAKYKIS